ncbi:MAG: hypothetical protein MAG431_02295 [Chloroflexi bacterium]|nr:hypothetical protein [Chloroflexota bacterium]
MPKQDFYEFIDRVQNMMERDQFELALSILENAPRHFQFRPDYLYLRGTVKGVLGNSLGGIEDLEEVVRRDRDYIPAYINLATAYIHMGWIGHAWRHAKNYLRRDPDDEYEAREDFEELLTIIETEISERSAAFDVSINKMRQAIMPHERAQMYLQNEDLRGVLKETKTAIRLVPQWPSPRNNRALALFMHGRLQEAISESETVLEEVDPENIFTLSNLVIFNVNAWKKEKAESYAARLRSLLVNLTGMHDHIDKAIEALGWLEDDETLAQVAKNIEEQEFLDDVSFYILGAGTVNMGQFEAAKKILQEIAGEETRYASFAKKGLKIIREAKQAHQPLAHGDRLPTIHFTQYWGKKIYNSFEQAVMEEPNAGLIKIVEKYPHLGYSFRLMLWQNIDNEITVETVLNTLADLDIPQAYAEIERFATSKSGTPHLRSMALQILSEEGIIDGETSVTIWQDDKENWTEVNFTQMEIVPYMELTCSQKSQELIEKGIELSHSDEEDDLIKAMSYYEQVLELDPDFPVALHNKGMVLNKLDRREEAIPLLLKSVEVDPDYLFGHLTLARIAFFEEDDVELCKDHLVKIMKAKRVIINVIIGAMELQVQVAIKEKEYEAAKTTLEMLISLDPDSEEFYTDWLERIEFAESFSGLSNLFTERAHKYYNRQFNKGIIADEDLESCIDRVSKDRLKATLESWGLRKSGKKAEVVARLVEALTDPDQLRGMIEHELTGEEREALAWVLAGDGVRSREAFVERFGDNYDESLHWQYHAPETIPGRLQMLGFLAIGTLDDQRVTLIPRELRPLLDEVLK